jgi:uncharacterized OsmC-like protein
LGENTGPTAVETLLAALGSCIAGTYAAHATARGVKLDELEVEVEVEVESMIDLNGFLQLAPTRAGLQGVRATLRVRADADEATSTRSGASSPRRPPCTTRFRTPLQSRARSNGSVRDLVTTTRRGTA